MRLHEREALVVAAEQELSSAMLEWMRGDAAWALTEYEWLRAVNNVIHGMTARRIMHSIRYERHGNTTTPGGLAE